MNQIIVRADDLGFSEGINYGIAKSVKEGIIKSVGVMTNMPSVIHGINLLRGEEVCYGLHTNICVGKPLSDPSKIPSIVNEAGEFVSSNTYRTAEKDFVVLDEVMIEIEAQYQKFVELFGFKPRYFEGHAVRSETFFKGLELVAKKYECDFLGNPPDHAPKFRNTILHASADFFNPNYDPFESLKNAALKKYPDGGISMLICHPGYLDAYIMKTSSLLKPRVLDVEMACADETKKWLKDNDVKVITYDEIA